VQFAGQQGMGISPDKPATDLLLIALKKGSEEERLASLAYLRQIPKDITPWLKEIPKKESVG
jgi:hypothetical protein